MSRKLLKSTSVVGSMTLLSRISGLVRDMAFAQFVGAGAVADAFFVAFRVPNFLRRIFGEGAFTVAFVPVFSEVRSRPGQDAHRFLGLMAGRLGLVLVLLSGLGVLFAPQIVWCLAPGFTDDPVKFGATVDALRLTFPYLFFISLVSMSAGILNTCAKFAAAAITPVFLNLALIAAVFLLVPWLDNDAVALGLGVVAAGVIQLFFQVPFLRREGYLPRPVLRDTAPDGAAREAVGKVFRLMLPAVFGSSIAQINILVNTLLASFLVTGSVSWLYYSDRLMEFPLGVFAIALATAILPGLSNRFAAGDADGFCRTLNVALRWVVIICLPAAAALAVLAVPLLATMFHYGEFGDTDVLRSADALKAYALGLVGMTFVKVLAPGFFARQNTATPVRVGAIAMVVNIVLAVSMVWWLEHVGLALATSLAAIVNAGLLWRILVRDRVLVVDGELAPLLWRVAAATAVMAVVLFYLAGAPGDWLASGMLTRVGRLVICVVSGLITYAMTLLIVGVRPRHLAINDA